MPTTHSVWLARQLHAQQRPFTIKVLGYASDGTPLLTDDGTEPYIITVWTVWHLDGEFRVYKVTNDKTVEVEKIPSVDAALQWVERLIHAGSKYGPDTVFTEMEARPMTTEALPLVYRKIARLASDDGGNTFKAFDWNGNFVMELTPEGAETLRAFNLRVS